MLEARREKGWDVVWSTGKSTIWPAGSRTTRGEECAPLGARGVAGRAVELVHQQQSQKRASLRSVQTSAPHRRGSLLRILSRSRDSLKK